MLKTEGIKNQYALKARNENEQLKDECTGEQTAEQKWNNLEKAIKEGNNLIPERESRARKPWMTEEILHMMDERQLKG